MSPFLSWGDIFTEQLDGDTFIEQQQTTPAILTRVLACRILLTVAENDPRLIMG
jgi:hypothetical protein